MKKEITIKMSPSEGLQLLKACRDLKQAAPIVEKLEDCLVHLSIDKWEHAQLLDLLKAMRETQTEKYQFFKTQKSC